MKSVLFKHRSIRKFRPTPIPEEVLRECLEAALRASTCGNMQLYSLVVTRDETLRERLAPCHFNQPMVRQAPCVVTVCADIHRFTMWCEQRDADPAYDNFAWFLNASTDALLAAQNLCVEAEMHGLGICYLGTTIYTAGDISQILELPKGVIPLTTVVLGYPDESPELTDRRSKPWSTTRSTPITRPPRSTNCGPSAKSRSLPNVCWRKTASRTWRRSSPSGVTCARTTSPSRSPISPF